MDAFLNQFFFGDYPYIAMTVFVVASIMRYDSSQYNWRSGSSQLLRGRGMVIASNFFHIGVLLLFMGHFIGLLTPESAYVEVITVPHKQLMAMTAGGIFGSFCFIGMTYLVYRRLFDARIRVNSTISDIVVLLLIYAQLLLGIGTIFVSAQHLDGSTMEAMGNWAQHIVTFRGGAANFLVGQPFIYKIHIVLGLTLFLITPFTRLVHVISAPFWYLFRSGYQIVRRQPRDEIMKRKDK